MPSCLLVAFIKSFLEHLGIITCDNNYVCYTALTALKARDSCLWYLDSGCSRHMTGNKALFKTLFQGKIGIVTFGDGSKSVIKGIGIVDIPRLLVFENVWYVDGLKANLLSISQICDNGLNVLFTKGLFGYSWKLKLKTEKHCSKIIFKYVNNTVGPIFNKKVAEKWNLWVREKCTMCTD